MNTTPTITQTETPRLTAREQEILSLAAKGLKARQIAGQLFVSKRTVEWHLENVYEKLGVRRRREAVAVWRAHPAHPAATTPPSRIGKG